MQRQRDDDAPFKRLHEGLSRQRKERVQRIGTIERGGEREEMQRQEDGKRDAGQTMQHGRDKAALLVRGAHQEHTATTARSPSTRRRPENRMSAKSSERPRHAVHSRTILRSPMGACTATASTNMA